MGCTAFTAAIHAAVGQRVGAFVAGVAVVAAHPVPVHVVLRRQSVQALPQSTFFTGFLSAVRQPRCFQPWIQVGDAVLHVLAVGVERHLAAALSAGQRLDHRGEFHAVVGGGALAAEQLLLVVRPSAAAHPSRPGPGCPCRRHRCRSSPSVESSSFRVHRFAPVVRAGAPPPPAPPCGSRLLAPRQADQAHAAHALDRHHEVHRAEHRPPALAGALPSSRSGRASAAMRTGGR